MNPCKYIVLDDDPTGVQCIHDLPVYIEWSLSTLRGALKSDYPMIFLLTNSRALTEDQTVGLHQDLARNLLQASRETGCQFQLISRGDSTLRGHYPLETDTLRDVLEQEGNLAIDGEIICPAFIEAGRITRNAVHYAWIDQAFVPVSETEFARDKTFGYSHSDLRDYIGEKSNGRVPRDQIITVGLDLLRSGDKASLKSLLETANGRKVVVDSESYDDLDQFTSVMRELIADGKTYLFRTAASFTRSIIAQQPRSLLTRHDLLGKPDDNHCAPSGLIFVGSHTQKTTAQLEALLAAPGIYPIE